jgi:hypothetical protein
VLLLFVYIGQRDHEMVDEARPLLGLLLPTALFAAPWVVSGILLGSYQTGKGIRAFMARALNTWLVAAPLGLLLRAYVLGRAVIPTVFITAALGFGGAMILGWRLVFALGQSWRQKRQPEVRTGSMTTASGHE